MSRPKLGATGKYPEGRMGPLDEGELQFGIASDHEKRLVHVNFGKPVAWFALPPENARELGLLLIKHADEFNQ